MSQSIVTEWPSRLPIFLIAGSVVFLIGATIGVPRVFMTTIPEERVRLLTEHLTQWRLAQAPYAIGPVIAAVGIAWSSAEASGWIKVARPAAGWIMLAGAITWSYSCWLRAANPVVFARGLQPGWPFHAYVILTLVGLAGIGAALLATERTLLGWVVLLADLAYSILYAATSDIPPFVFYLLLLVVGIAL